MIKFNFSTPPHVHPLVGLMLRPVVPHAGRSGIAGWGACWFTIGPGKLSISRGSISLAPLPALTAQEDTANAPPPSPFMSLILYRLQNVKVTEIALVNKLQFTIILDCISLTYILPI